MSVEILINSISIIDTDQHSYITDPNYIYYPKVGRVVPETRAYAIWVNNTANEPVTITPIVNIVNTGVVPDIQLVDSYTVEPGDTDIRFFPFEDYPVNYLSLVAQYSTAPTSGGLLAYLILNGQDPTVETVVTQAPTGPQKPLSGFYEVIITATGIPAGDIWSASINGVVKTTNTDQLIFYELSGTYPYQIYSTGYYVYKGNFYTYTPTPSTGNIVVQNSNTNINVTFTGTQTPVNDIYSNQSDVAYINGLGTVANSTNIITTNPLEMYNGQSDMGYINSQGNVQNYINIVTTNPLEVYNGQSDTFTYTNS